MKKETGKTLIEDNDAIKAARYAENACGKRKSKKRSLSVICASAIILLLAVLISFSSCSDRNAGEKPQSFDGESETVESSQPVIESDSETEESKTVIYTDELDSLPEYDGKTPYITVHGNIPYFTDRELSQTTVFEKYSELDSLGRCGAAFANICRELMPTEKREDISSVKPSGWEQAMYDCISGKALYNRSHLIAFQLAGENANEQNLITGTEYMNHDGMIPFENMVADYVKETNGHVLYRVTPIFKGSELVARGVLMEAYSVEDKGEGVCYCVYCYNVQPGIEIDYATGKSREADKASDTTEKEYASAEESPEGEELREYVLNTKSMKYHLPTCNAVVEMKESNKQLFVGTEKELTEKGYTPCGTCKP